MHQAGLKIAKQRVLDRIRESWRGDRRGFEGVFMGVCSSVDVTQSEGDLPDFNQSEH